MDIIAQQTSTSDDLRDMALLEQTVKDLRKTAKETKESKTTSVEVNGRTCIIAAAYKEEKKVEITVEYGYTPLGSRVCQRITQFVYDKSNVGSNLGTIIAQIAQIDQRNAHTKAHKITEFTATLDKYIAKGIDIADFPTCTPGINKTLDNIQTFVYRNDLSPDEISTLKTAVVGFGSNEQLIQFPNKSSSINENDCNSHCLGFALRLEAIEMLLDAKEKGYVGLERNVPPEVLGKGRYNTVLLAHTEKNQQGPLALKPCDLSKKKENSEEFTLAAQTMQLFVGPACGSYRRNKTTSMLQDMLCEIGRRKNIAVPRVMTSVSAAEMQGIPCIAMERVNGLPIWQASHKKEIPYDNSFVCQETWMQLLDILTGQIDRHANNAMYKNGRIVAFDHDLSFVTHPPRSFASIIPKFITVPTDIAENGRLVETAVDGLMTTNYCMPPVIDQEMYAVIMAIDLGALENMYRRCGLIKPEIKAAMARAQGLQAAAQKLKDENLVIKPNAWVTSPLVQARCNEHNFYAKWHLRLRHGEKETG